MSKDHRIFFAADVHGSEVPFRKKRVLLYSHDTFGLGHTKRTVSIASAILQREPESVVLYITGSPIIQNLRLPTGMDYVKLPSVTKRGPRDYDSRYLRLHFAEVLRLRTHLIRTVAERFQPDVFLVDHAPTGMCGEILPTLRELYRHQTKIVLGLRDILDDPANVSPVWEEEGIVEILREFYQLILVYGMQELYDPIAEYRLPSGLRSKTRFTGYVHTPKPVQSGEDVRRRFQIPPGPFVLITVGGGEDGAPFLRFIMAGLRELEGFSALVITGPMCPDLVRKELEQEGGNSIIITDFVEDLPSVMAAADLVVSMGGYNSICELLAFGRRGIVLPRTTPRREQFIRASLLARLGLIKFVDISESEPAVLRDALEVSLADKSEPLREKRHLVQLNGAFRAAEEILDMRERRLVLQHSLHGEDASMDNPLGNVHYR